MPNLKVVSIGEQILGLHDLARSSSLKLSFFVSRELFYKGIRIVHYETIIGAMETLT